MNELQMLERMRSGRVGTPPKQLFEVRRTETGLTKDALSSAKPKMMTHLVTYLIPYHEIKYGEEYYKIHKHSHMPRKMSVKPYPQHNVKMRPDWYLTKGLEIMSDKERTDKVKSKRINKDDAKPPEFLSKAERSANKAVDELINTLVEASDPIASS